MVLVVGADVEAVEGALEGVGDDDVLVLDGSAARLERVEAELRDPRLWFLIGDSDVIPLPDRSVDAVLGAGASPEVERVGR